MCEGGGVFQLSAERRVDIKDAQLELVAFRILLHVDWRSIESDIGSDSSQIRKVNMTWLRGMNPPPHTYTHTKKQKQDPQYPGNNPQSLKAKYKSIYIDT